MVLSVTDDTSWKIADVMWNADRKFPNRSQVMMSDRSMHGEELTLSVTDALTTADQNFGVTKFPFFTRIQDLKRSTLANMLTSSDFSIQEKGIRLVNNAPLRNAMLEDEGVMGTLRFGFGSDISFGRTTRIWSRYGASKTV